MGSRAGDETVRGLRGVVIERLEQIAEALVDLLPAHLERRGEELVLDGEGLGDDDELLQGLVARELRVDLIEALLDERARLIAQMETQTCSAEALWVNDGGFNAA